MKYNDLSMDYDDLLEKYQKIKKDCFQIEILDQKNKDYEKGAANLRKEIEGLNLIVKQRNDEINKWRGQNSKLEMHINEIRLKESLYAELQTKNEKLKKENESLRIKIEEFSSSQTTIINHQSIINNNASEMQVF